MSHGITSSDSMMSVRQRPWHGLGNVLETRPRDIDEALVGAGVTWEYVKSPIYLPGGEGRGEPVEGYVANVRSDTGTVLGIVSPLWNGPQPREAFQFLADLLGSEAAFETAGSLWAGKQVFVTVSLAELPWVEVGGDRVDLFVNFFTSYDGSRANTLLRTKVRTVCNNTWLAALGDALYKYAFRHVGDWQQQMFEAREQLHLTIDHSLQFKQWGDRLASQRIAEHELARITAELWPNEGTDRTVKSHQRRREAVMHLFVDGDTVGNAPGSKWCAANALLEHIEWAPKVRSATGRFVRHIQDPDGLKARALEMVVAA